jgi:hypothetical protein
MPTCERSHEIEQSHLAKARCVALSPIDMAKNEQRQLSSRRFVLSHVCRERLARSIEGSTHHFERFGIVNICEVAGREHFILPFFAIVTRRRLCCRAQDEESTSSFRYLKKFCEDCKSAFWRARQFAGGELWNFAASYA